MQNFVNFSKNIKIYLCISFVFRNFALQNKNGKIKKIL